MRRAILLGIVFAAGLLVFLIAFLPLSVAMALSGAEESGLDWSRAAGTVWDGRLEDVSYQRRMVGDLTLGLQPAPLLAGRLSVGASLRGRGLAGEGVAQIGPGGRLALYDARINTSLQQAQGLDPRLRGRDGTLTLDLDRVVFAGGECREAEGIAWTDALVHGDPRADWTGPPLEGPAMCDGPDLVVSLAGEDGSGEYRAQARLGPQTPFRVTARVRSSEPNLRSFLTLLGFRRDGEFYAYSWPREGA